MSRKSPRVSRRISTARVRIRSSDCEDRGVGVIVTRRPLTVLVPSHLIVLLEDGEATSVGVGGTEYPKAEILSTPSLQGDHLSVLRFGRPGSRDFTAVRLPKRAVRLSPGQSVSLRGPADAGPLDRSGRVVHVRERGDGPTVVTDIKVAPGESGSAVLVSEKLAGICQGMATSGDTGAAIAVPLSNEGLAELQRFRRHVRIHALSVAIGLLLTVALAVGGFALHSWRSFDLASIEIPEDGGYVVARNAQSMTLRSSWHRSFETPIRRYEMIAEGPDGDPAYVAIGTIPRDGVNGAFVLLDRRGEELWRYSIPDGECVYAREKEAFDAYLVDGIYHADLSGDGRNELLVVFVHDHFEPCKLLVFDLSGEILAEYWHPGYIRTIAVGRVGDETAPLVVVSASNNAIKTDWWNPQTLFAFRGLAIAGQAPPYTGGGGGGSTDPGTELWYRVIDNIDPEFKRAKCSKIDLVDSNGDGAPEIRAALTDGRFYYLDEHGTELRVDLGDQFLKDFPGSAAPPLIELPLH